VVYPPHSSKVPTDHQRRPYRGITGWVSVSRLGLKHLDRVPVVYLERKPLCYVCQRHLSSHPKVKCLGGPSMRRYCRVISGPDDEGSSVSDESIGDRGALGESLGGSSSEDSDADLYPRDEGYDREPREDDEMIQERLPAVCESLAEEDSTVQGGPSRGSAADRSRRWCWLPGLRVSSRHRPSDRPILSDNAAAGRR
jgi:hypothetical protein